MKKFLAITLGAMLAFGFTASAFATPASIPADTQAVVAKGKTQITLGGEIRMRGWYTNDVSTNGMTIWDDVNNNGAINAGEEIFWRGSFFIPANRQLGSDFRVDANDGSMHGTSPQDTGSDAWYDGRVRLSIQADVSKNTTGFVQLESAAGMSRTSDGYVWGSLNEKPPAGFNILQAWIQHKGTGLLGIPAGFKIGHQPLALGEKQFLDLTKFGTDAIVFFMDPTKELHIGLLTAKVVEGSTLDNTDDIDAYTALMTYKLDPNNTVGLNYTFINGADLRNITLLGVANSLNDASLKFHNFGLHANGRVAGVTYRGEVDIQSGSVVLGDGTKTKVRGLGIFVEAGYKVDPVTVRARYGYGSGDKPGTEDKIEEFQTILGRDIHHTFIYEYILDGAAEIQLFPSGTATLKRSRGLANTSMYSLGLSFTPVKDLTASIDGYLLRANKTEAGISKNIGSEVDVRLAYNIDRNLSYSITAGYFSPGKYWEDWYSYRVLGIEKKSVLAVMHALTLRF